VVHSARTRAVIGNVLSWSPALDEACARVGQSSDRRVSTHRRAASFLAGPVVISLTIAVCAVASLIYGLTFR
jgi:hypothetical protein